MVGDAQHIVFKCDQPAEWRRGFSSSEELCYNSAGATMIKQRHMQAATQQELLWQLPRMASNQRCKRWVG
jgi:hypothetical protein